MGAIYDIDGNQIITGGGDTGDEAVAREKLTGKVLIALGDSYTVGMTTQLSVLATKYGMILDGRGIVGSNVCAHNGYIQPMCNRVETIASDYANGYTIGGSTYYADDVAIITFMGGANDGVSVIGNGLHDTDVTTIYGAMHKIFKVLQENFTKAIVMGITQPANYSLVVSAQVTDDTKAQKFGFSDMEEALVLDDVQFSNYCMGMKENAIRDMVIFYEAPLIDMYYEFPPVLNPANRSAYWNSDKLHLTSAGYDIIASAIDKKIIEIWGTN